MTELWCQLRVRNEIMWEVELPCAPWPGERVVLDRVVYTVKSREWDYDDNKRQMVLILHGVKNGVIP